MRTLVLSAALGLTLPGVASAAGPSEWDHWESLFFRLGWQLESTPAEVPLWYEENRTQGHADNRLRAMSPTHGLDTPVFLQAAARFRELGAEAFVRVIKTCTEDPWWPSAAPRGPSGERLFDEERVLRDCFGREAILASGRNVVREMVDEAHDQGSSVIGYYWHMSDETVASFHWDWVCKEPDGVTAARHSTHGPILDLTTPYREIVLTRLLELAEMGLDGVYFDNRHLPPDGCWGTALEEAFRAATGLEPPRAKNEADSTYRLFLGFQALKMEETFAYWRARVKRAHPDFLFLISATSVPALINSRMTTNLVRLADAPKSEYFLALNPALNLGTLPDPELATPPDDVRMALGWTLLRDSSDGGPPHIWSPGSPDTPHVLGFAASVLTYGGVANLNVAADTLAGEDPQGATPRDSLRAALEMGSRVSPFLSRSRPLRWAAVHFSELARNRRGTDLKKAWREVVGPVTGAFGVLLREGLPLGLVNDYQLETGELQGYRVLFLPNPTELTSHQRRVVARFVSRGGVVIRNLPFWHWSDPDGVEEAREGFVRRLRLAQRHWEAPVQLVGAPEKAHAVAFENPAHRQLLVAVTNDFTWVQIRPVPFQPGKGSHFHMGEAVTDEIHAPPPPVRGVQVVVRGRPRPFAVFEAVSGRPLVVRESEGGCRVELPEFPFMALLVVDEGPLVSHSTVPPEHGLVLLPKRFGGPLLR